MDNIFVLLISSFLMAYFYVHCWNDIGLNNNLYKKVISLILITSIFVFANCFLLQFNKIIIIYLLNIMVNYFFVSKNLKQAFLSVVIPQLIIWFSEFVFAAMISSFYTGNIQKLVLRNDVFIIMHLFVLILSLIINKFGLTLFLYNLLLGKKTKNKNMDSLIYSIIMIIVMIVATMETYMKLPFNVILIINMIISVIFIIIVIKSSKNKNEYNKINSKYQTSIYSLKEYEIMIDKFSMLTHENKNEFQTIRNMIKTGESKEIVVKYIDRLIDNKIKDNDKIMKKASKIPEGGLKATIYSKLCAMEKLKIKYKLRISRDVHTTDLIDLDENLTLKICKILGVFLDNAIDAVENLDMKQISIEMYVFDEWLCIDITNNFKGMIDLNKISDLKYTTKGSGHGYGLPLVKQILDEEKNVLENEKSINGNTFTQTLKIKM